MSNVPPGQPGFPPPGGGPNPYQTPQGMPPPQPPGFFATYWWLFAGGIPLLLVACCCGGCILVPFMLSGEFVASYNAALDAVRASPEVREKLGEPIEGQLATQSNVNVTNDVGDAKFVFEVKGPKGRATVRTELKKANGKWTPSELKVTFEDNTSVQLAP